MTLAPRSDSPRSTRSAPHPTGMPRQFSSALGSAAKREGRPSTRGESPRSVKSVSTGRTPDGVERVSRRTSSVESQSSADSRSCNRRSPSENKKNYPDEIKRHLNYGLQNTEGLSETQLKEIPYTKVETAKTVKIRYGSPKGKRHKSPRRTKSNSDRKEQEDPQSHQQPNSGNPQNGVTESSNKSADVASQIAKQESDLGKTNENKLLNGSLRPCPRVSQTLTNNQGQNINRNGNNISYFNNHSSYNNQDPNLYKTCNYGNGSHNNNSENSQSQYPHQSHPSGDAFLQPHRDSAPPRDSQLVFDGEEVKEFLNNEYINSNGGGFLSQCPSFQKNATTERNLQYTSVLKPQPSPQSSVTSGISVGSSSVSIATESSFKKNSRSLNHHHANSNNNHYSIRSLSCDNRSSTSPDSDNFLNYDKQTSTQDNFSSPEPFYINTNTYSPPLTQHSTNILIQYHDSNSSNASTGHKTPTPTPRSSIISSIHCTDESTHIVQSYGPTYANSHVINSLKRSRNTPSNSRPSSSLSVYSTPLTNYNKLTDFPQNNIPNYSSLPRTHINNKPLTKSIGSQTQLNKVKDSFLPKNEQIDLGNDPKTLLSRKVLSLSYNGINSMAKGRDEHVFRTGNTNLSPSTNIHWKIYNWDTGRNGEQFSGSLSRSNLPQELCNIQASTTLAESNEVESHRSHMGTGNDSYQIRNRERNCTSDSTFKKHNNDSQILTGTKVVNGISGIKKSQVTQLQKSYVQLNGHVPKEKESNIQRRVTKENSWNNSSSFNGGTNEYTEDAFIDKGYHTIEKGFNLSTVNYRKNFFTGKLETVERTAKLFSPKR
ncbi:hypothetical protein Anas_03780 [Armadillidium nasatum]|uniref:Uncharacterized protein n=1 Tax=Armadillidium nasatum TaxID=96803 RepID=A0A5N5TIZ7_9CRUS|nr:hypothetical protein Anas_03780 [Armadillidium nasatum]